jgi:CBS domain-containing protein
MARYNRIKVVDVMTKNPLVMTPAETIGQADELMTENRIRQLPVVMKGALQESLPIATFAPSLRNRRLLNRRNGRKCSGPRSAYNDR